MVFQTPRMIADSLSNAWIELLPGLPYFLADFLLLLSAHYAKRELSSIPASRE